MSATTASTNSTSGALTVGGGLGVAAKLFVGTDLDVNGTTNLDATNVVGTLAVTGSATISSSSGDTLTLTKDTTEPSLRIEGDSNKDFVFTVSGELLTLTQNDGTTDIVTFDHDTKAASFSGTLIAKQLASADGVLLLDDNGSHNGIINSPASLRINIDSDNGATGESFQVGKNQTTIDANNILFSVAESGDAHFSADVDLLQAKHIRFKHAAGGTIRASISAEANDNLQFNTGQSETARMTIDGNGQVYTTTGITGADTDMATGFVAPTGAVYSRGLITAGARSNNGGYLSGFAIVNGDNAANGGSAANGRIVANIAGVVVTSDGNAGDDSGADLTFFTKPEAGTLAERMRISAAGDVTFSGSVIIPANLQHAGDSDTMLQFSAANTIRLVAGNVETFKTTASEVTINEGSADLDFRVESNSLAHFFYIDGGTNSGRGHITMGDMGTTDTGNMVTISSPTTNALRAQIAGNGTAIELVCTDSNANAGPNLDLRRIATGANNDVLGFVRFMGGDNGGNIGHVYAQLGAKIQTATHGSEDGIFVIETLIGNSAVERVQMDETETVFNEGSADLDFRVESDDSINAFVVNGANDSVSFGKATDGLTDQGSAFSNLQANGHHFLAVTNTSSTANNSTMYINRQTSDGKLILLRHANADEGSIEVDGNTVSFNGFSGRHESSGIAANTAVGTVVSTIDELDVYPDTQSDVGDTVIANPKAGQTRANHAKVKVSDAEGDACVYGVVAKFTEQDKVIVTSVGIGSVRVTGSCAKGDLLESNGDGTAKVQSDDIVRSKTLGKVTIGNSNTGVKLVSCVMYCG